MTSGILVDTTFLITLVNADRPRHDVAACYYKLALEQRIPLYLSAIAVSEFEIKQPITDLPLSQFMLLPFNVTHARKAGQLWNLLKREDGDGRAIVRDDTKLIAQAAHENIPFILTEDEKTLAKYCGKLRDDRHITTRAVLLRDGFEPGSFRQDGQRGLPLEPDPQ